MDGFLNIYKEKGPTSYDVIRALKKILKIKRIGHAGNLDPLGEGVLVVGVGKATRFLEFIMNETKEYRVKVKFGILTTTLDSEGEVIQEMPVPILEEGNIREVLTQFQGEIEQIPPSFSAIKFEGKRLYEYAREGIFLVPKPRRVKINRIDLLDVGKDYIIIDVECSSGTYMRSLARDIAQKLGTVGIVQDLIRLRVGDYRIEKAVRVDEATKVIESIIPIHEGLPMKTAVYLNSAGASMFMNGNRVPRRFISKLSSETRAFSLVKVFDHESNFLGVGFLTWEGVEPKKVYVPEE
uniref:tRNA pseudouridine synthase B n=1 Tax=candidate division WOR-3 bacterium TaxID=2052148 RepID=A0A7V3ZZH7_UNCW3